MKAYILSFLTLLILKTSLGQESYLISGRIQDTANKQILGGAAIKVKGTKFGTYAKDDGSFELKVNQKLPFTLLVSFVGYATQEFNVENQHTPILINLSSQDIYANQVVVTSSRVPESILKSPVAIQKLDIRAIKETPAPTFYDALENVKGVQMTTSSLTFKVPNTRGFNIPNNFRFMQLVDGVDMQAATLGVPLGNAIGPTELDIASVEITPGAASALYGMNAINGLANLLTKSPFTHQGLSFYQRGGVNHVDNKDHAAALFSETAIRYAKAWNDKWAFKINASYLKGIDWISDTRNDQNPNNLKSANPDYPELNGINNVAYDGWNKYGDDALQGSNTVSITGLTINGIANRSLRVARTGYWEKDLVSPKVANLKLDIALHYKINKKTELSYAYRVGQMDGVFQRGNKVRLDGVVVQNHKLELKGSNFLVRSYVSIENTGNSYNVKPLADNLDLYGAYGEGSSSKWQARFKNALNQFSASHGGLVSNNLADATQFARAEADRGRAEPGTPYFDSLVNVITKINNWDIKSSAIPNAPATGGAALIQKSRLYHIEGQWDLSKSIKVIDLLVGADARVYELIPDGNNFVDFSRPLADRSTPLADGTFGKNTYYQKYGAFAQATKTFFDEKLKVFASLRYDYNPEFSPKITPRLAAVYTHKQSHNFRFTFQQGYRFPALFEALSFVNNGRVRRVGGLAKVNEGLNYFDNSYTQSSVVNFNAAVSAAGNSDAAALANRNLLEVANLQNVRPEKINSFEVGYKSVLLNNRLVLDFDAYYNIYDGFLGQVQVFVPKGVKVGSDAAVIAMLDRNRDATNANGGNSASLGQDRYRVYTNAKNTYYNYGAALGINFQIYKKYTIGTNVNYNKMQANDRPDIFVTGFNSPEWSGNVSFGNREIVKNIGFNVVYKWQQSFLWESPLVTGTIPAFSTVDAQISFKVPKYQSLIKVGGTNLLNKRYLQYAGGPTLGGLYYIAYTLDLNTK